MFDVPHHLLSFVQDTRSDCVENGSCYGYTDLCAQECLKHFGPVVVLQPAAAAAAAAPTGPDHHGSHNATPSASSDDTAAISDSDVGSDVDLHEPNNTSHHHHHHVPTNAFMALGLQTCIAITLHKFPEGFITYATNHANPALGFSVFMALFVHNISEGFTLALPLYMALQSRARALAWAAALGGLTQPLGAALAAAWLKLAAGWSVAPGSIFYAVLFAATAGIMVSVALQLFAESVNLCHNRNLCLFFGFLGMALLGFSGTLVGGDEH